MAQYTLVGNQLTALLESEDSDYKQDKTGVCSASVKYTGKWPGAVTQASAITRHPDFPYLVRESFSVTRVSPLLAEVTMEFRGVENGEHSAPAKRYKTKMATSQEPIETHPDFAAFGGLPKEGGGTNDKGAMFDEKMKFTGFAVEDTVADPPKFTYPSANQNKAGVRAYLAKGLTFTETITFNENQRTQATAVLDNICEYGGRVDPPSSSWLLPTPSGAENWLLVDGDVEEVGDGVKVTRTWRLSGPRGWDQDIYGS